MRHLKYIKLLTHFKGSHVYHELVRTSHICITLATEINEQARAREIKFRWTFCHMQLCATALLGDRGDVTINTS